MLGAFMNPNPKDGYSSQSSLMNSIDRQSILNAEYFM